jgi:Flp pilus assembly protein TadD
MPKGTPGEAASLSPSQHAHAEAHYRAGRYAEAAALLAAPAAAEPPDVSAVRLLGLCRLRQGDREEALRLLRRAFELAPGDAWAALHLGLGLAAVGRHAEAARLFRAAMAGLPEASAPAVNLATSLMALGDRAGAERAARKAVLRAPRQAGAHYTLGLVHLAAGRLEPACAAFAAATARAPRMTEAWVNLGVALYRLGRMEAAKKAMRVAVAADPGNRAAVGNLGAMMRLTGEGDAAEALLADLIRRDPDAAEARVNLAAQLLAEDRPAEALGWLDAPLPAEPRISQHWRLEQVLGLLQQRNCAEARRILDGIGEVAPGLRSLVLWRRLALAEADREPDEAVRIAREVETAAAAEPGLVPEHRIMLYFDLGRFWSGQRDAAAAVRCWEKGHAELARFQPFSRADYAAFVDATMARFDHARLLAGPRAANRDEAPVFIVGMPRSGTTLVEQILAAHPEVFGAGERVALAEAFRNLGGGVETREAAERIASAGAPALDAAATHYLAELHALAPEARRIVDKMPGNFRYLGLVALMLPGARIIHCRRDPRDIGFSILTYRFYGQHAYAHDLADLGWYIGQQHRLMAHWRRALPNPLLEVRLNDWIEDFAGTLRRLLDFLGLPFDAACERFYEVDRPVRTVSRRQVREPVNARGIGRWRPYGAELGRMIAELRAAGVLTGWPD